MRMLRKNLFRKNNSVNMSNTIPLLVICQSSASLWSRSLVVEFINLSSHVWLYVVGINMHKFHNSQSVTAPSSQSTDYWQCTQWRKAESGLLPVARHLTACNAVLMSRYTQVWWWLSQVTHPDNHLHIGQVVPQECHTWPPGQLCNVTWTGTRSHLHEPIVNQDNNTSGKKYLRPKYTFSFK